jgi:hypothetical protein
LNSREIVRKAPDFDNPEKAQIKQMRAAPAARIMIAEDWGTQLGLLINPKLWRGRGGFIAGFYTNEPSIGLEQVAKRL